ncbi:jg7931 [Pararge aegeria aegeria]|uniref:Jg7931 protein n=1 Tax=Pararge aegeria aegeria TaxID=348720 RepID=A0A8S4R7C4_9NEOP|nr:jg7931 [Pararge aegeria aegeria]
MILLIYTALASITGAMCSEEKQNVEYGTNLNITTLYPIQNNLIHSNINNKNNNTYKSQFEVKSDTESKEVSGNGDKSVGEYIEDNNKTSKEFDLKTFLDDDDTITIKDDIENRTHSNAKNNEKEKPKVPKLDTVNWKIDTAFTRSKLEKPEDVIDKNQNDSDSGTLQATGKEFKPSPQLGHFYDEDAFVVPTQESIGSFSPLNNPSTFFSSPPGDFYKLNYKPPISYPNPIDAPYKFENSRSKYKDWKFNSGIDPKLKIEAPAKIPAGGLYKLPDPFKEKPSSDGDDDNFGLDFNDEEKDAKENPVKKRGNPWKSFLNLVTALLPVGIILSALTPNIITLESTDINPQ